ncbi:hypothetical protein EUTSA_v10000591mg [Eutrema salsugineum]|uniref:Encoded peptide n=1 Tax=Eutrema salsugineum TaxID=72664 RepID=V4M237_EUTSA|nr:precursor of CEP3 [Eutrema salsugineum]ESQ46283.1 hypothetical protein EUTSA_v10000591mg [Eutrema salsugineum]
MARINVYFIVFIFLLTINLSSVEGRTLVKSTVTTAKDIETDNSVPPSPLQPPSSHGVDTFRPTVPGHSPGIGHAVLN